MLVALALFKEWYTPMFYNIILDKKERMVYMKIVRFVSFVLISVFLLSVLCSCHIDKYEAVLYDDRFGAVRKWMDEDFLAQNRVSGFYKDENGEIFEVKGQKGPIVHVLTEEEQYNIIFSNSPIEIDFDKKMVIVYIFTDNSQRNYSLESVSIIEGTLSMKIERYNSKIDDSVWPYQRCFMIVLNKSEITDVDVDIGISRKYNQEEIDK